MLQGLSPASEGRSQRMIDRTGAWFKFLRGGPECGRDQPPPLKPAGLLKWDGSDDDEASHGLDLVWQLRCDEGELDPA